MKIAIACDNNKVSEHFGHCEAFRIYEVENNQILNKEEMKNPGHEPGVLPEFLHKKGVEIIMSGGMGRKAQELFKEVDIDIITGVSGSLDGAIENFLSDSLVTNGEICDRHEHKDECHK